MARRGGSRRKPSAPQAVRGAQGFQRIVEAAGHTYRGLVAAWVSEAAFRQEVAVGLLALPVGWYLAPNLGWYVAMIASLLAVLAVELLNTAIEKLADHLAPAPHPAIGRVKDFGSAAVFCALLLAGIVWLAALGIRVGLL
ncbi:MAG TPA: diacylglycerol kinase [Xanthobacteraceae bacterium]|jgi:diacylglycerol kinase (ATP)